MFSAVALLTLTPLQSVRTIRTPAGCNQEEG
jgi:hypothetical protein